MKERERKGCSTVQNHQELEYAIAEITEIAQDFGLDFYPMRYEICPADIIYTFGAYGMPTRFSHWSFGKAFHKMKLQYDLNLSKIYELVINSNPCYAFLLKGNSLIQNKLIVAHVLAHCDFFKNNARFTHTSRDMVESMAASAERIRKYEIKYGKEVVEEFLDHVLAIQEHINPSIHDRIQLERQHAPPQTAHPTKRKTPYDDLWELDHPQQSSTNTKIYSPKTFPSKPEKDLLLFIMNHSRVLEEWHQDILTILRNEMLYFWPQLETKIMNEGWASYWHIRIMRELDLTEEETIEFAKLNASVIQPSTTSINPYFLGLKIFEDLEKRWNQDTTSSISGREKIFEVREIDSDVSFLRNYLTKELVEELDLYIYQLKGDKWQISDKDWENVRDQLVRSYMNGGHPYIVVKDGDYLQNGELYLLHQYEGIELDIKYLEKTLPHIYALWGKNVYLETKIENRSVLFSYNGKKCLRRFL